MSNISLPSLEFDILNIDWSTLNLTPKREVSNIRGLEGSLRMFLHSTGNSDDYDMEFHFPFPSSQIQFSDLSSTYTEIQRPKLIPIVEFSGHKLMKFQMEFLLSHIGNGITIPVDEHIAFLRRMATSKQGISFAEGNNMLMSPLSYKGISAVSSPMYYITDMSVNAQRMTSDNKGIAAATVSMSFTEARNPVIQVIQMPKIKYTATTPKKKKTVNAKNKTRQVTLTGGKTPQKGGIYGGTGTKTQIKGKKKKP